MACAIEPHRCARLGKVAHAECFAGASPCAPNSRAARGVRYHTTRGTTAGPNHYDACEGCPLSPVRARIAMAARHPEQCASRTPVPGSHCASCDADPWCGWHFVRVCGAMGTSRPTAYYPREIPPIPRPMVRFRGAVPWCGWHFVRVGGASREARRPSIAPYRNGTVWLLNRTTGRGA